MHRLDQPGICSLDHRASLGCGPRDGLWTPGRSIYGTQGSHWVVLFQLKAFGLSFFFSLTVWLCSWGAFWGHTLVPTCWSPQALGPSRWTWLFLTLVGLAMFSTCDHNALPKQLPTGCPGQSYHQSSGSCSAWLLPSPSSLDFAWRWPWGPSGWGALSFLHLVPQGLPTAPRMNSYTAFKALFTSPGLISHTYSPAPLAHTCLPTPSTHLSLDSLNTQVSLSAVSWQDGTPGFAPATSFSCCRSQLKCPFCKEAILITLVMSSCPSHSFHYFQKCFIRIKSTYNEIHLS